MRCPRCIGGWTAKDLEGDQVCIMCGWREPVQPLPEPRVITKKREKANAVDVPALPAVPQGRLSES